MKTTHAKKGITISCLLGMLFVTQLAISARPDLSELTAEQRAELYSSRIEMQQAGAAPSAIREAHCQLLSQWGQPCPATDRALPPHLAALEELSQEQRADFHRQQRELAAAGKSRRDVREAGRELLKSWGIELPAPPAGRKAVRGQAECDGKGPGPDKACRPGRGPGKRGAKMRPGAFDNKLSDEQRASLFELRESMLVAGASRQELREAHRNLLSEWGIQPPVERPESMDRPDEEMDEGLLLDDGRELRHAVSPNPFNPATHISYQPLVSGPVQLAVYDMRGALVRQLSQEAIAGTRLSFRWDGCDTSGKPAASGTYIYRITADGDVLEGSMSLMR